MFVFFFAFILDVKERSYSIQFIWIFGQFYDLSKIHKLKEGEGVNELPFRPIISNIDIATYEVAKYLAKQLSPLNKSNYSGVTN